jgi:hypothetical protein
MAHVLCELYVRLKAVGLTNGDAYEFPLTQVSMAARFPASEAARNQATAGDSSESL